MKKIFVMLLFCTIKLQSQNLVKDSIKKDSVYRLNEIGVVSKKKEFVKKIDRTEVLITPQKENFTIWELIKKSPGVIVNGNAISTKGKSVLVTINDKKINLSGEDLKTFLESMPSSDLKKIEIIDNPPARYEASGGAIINLKTKTLKNDGLKGSLGTGLRHSLVNRGSVNSSLYFKHKKWDLASSYNLSNGQNLRTDEDYIYYTENDSYWLTKMKRETRFKAKQNLRFALDFTKDSSNVFSFEYLGYINNDNVETNNSPTTITKQSTGDLIGGLNTMSTSVRPMTEHDFSFTYLRKFKNSASLTSVLYFTDFETKDNLHFSTLTKSNNSSDGYSFFDSFSKQSINLVTMQLDYVLKNFETGIKTNKATARINYSLFPDAKSELILQKGKYSLYEYDEMNYAGYFSYLKEWKKWSVKLGLRSETTGIKSTALTNSYTQLFPTLYLQYKANENHQFNMNYGKRIDRPQYTWFNPNRFYYNLYSYFEGDAELKPSFTHAVDFGYILKNKHNFGLTLSQVNLPFIEISFQYPENQSIGYKLTNIDSTKQINVNYATDYTLFKIWSTNIYLSCEFKEDKFRGIDRNIYAQDVFSYYINFNNQFEISKKKNFTANIDFYYASGSVQGNMNLGAQSNCTVGFRKLYWDKKLELSLLFSDIFKGEKQRIVTRYANQNNGFSDYSDTRSVRLGIKFNLGNQLIKTKKQKEQTIEQKRL